MNPMWNKLQLRPVAAPSRLAISTGFLAVMLAVEACALFALRLPGTLQFDFYAFSDTGEPYSSGQRPLHVLGSGDQVRHYTYGGDVARGIRIAMESPSAINEDFNISTARSTTVLELAELIWRKIDPREEFSYVCDPPFPHDVQMRVPDVRKARDVLGFEALVGLDAVLDEVIPWIAEQTKLGRM